MLRMWSIVELAGSGFVGMSYGEYAGQTGKHAHIHLISRGGAIRRSHGVEYEA